MVVELLPGSLQGRVTIPPSKSAAHRAVICAALARGESIVRPAALSEDIRATVRAAEALGAQVRILEEEDCLVIRGVCGRPSKAVEIDCGESGSTLRFFVPIAAALGAQAVFRGQGKLPQRPMTPLVEALSAHGVKAQPTQGEIPSLSGRLESGNFEISGSVSSQYISGLLFALPLLEGDSIIQLTSPLESKGYVDMTIQMMRRFGVTVETRRDGYTVPGGQEYQPRRCDLEGDYSNGAYWLCAGALGSHIEVWGLDSSSLQGDRQIVSILRDFGADLTVRRDHVKAQRGRLVSVDVDVRDVPDLAPILAVTAAYANGATTIYNAGRLRIKESDRLHAITQGLKNLGAGIVEYTDKLVILGQDSLRGGEADSFGDHRIAMALSIAALGCENAVRVTGAECVSKSYPTFFHQLAGLGGNCRVV